MKKPTTLIRASVIILCLATITSCGAEKNAADFYHAAEAARTEQRLREAELFYTESLKLSESTNPQLAADDLLGLSSLFILQQRWKDAQQNLERAVLLLRRADQVKSERFVNAVSQLATVNDTLQNYKEEIALLKRALEVLDELGRPDLREYCRKSRELARAQLLAKEFADAERTCQRTLPLEETLSGGKNGEEYGLDQRLLGKSCALQGKQAEASTAFEQAISIFSKQRGSHSAAVYGTFVDWRDSLSTAGMHDRSKELQKRMDKQFPPDAIVEGVDPAELSQSRQLPNILIQH